MQLNYHGKCLKIPARRFAVRGERILQCSRLLPGCCTSQQRHTRAAREPRTCTHLNCSQSPCLHLRLHLSFATAWLWEHNEKVTGQSRLEAGPQLTRAGSHESVSSWQLQVTLLEERGSDNSCRRAAELQQPPLQLPTATPAPWEQLVHPAHSSNTHLSPVRNAPATDKASSCLTHKLLSQKPSSLPASKQLTKRVLTAWKLIQSYTFFPEMLHVKHSLLGRAVTGFQNTWPLRASSSFRLFGLHSYCHLHSKGGTGAARRTAGGGRDKPGEHVPASLCPTPEMWTDVFQFQSRQLLPCITISTANTHHSHIKCLCITPESI